MKQFVIRLTNLLLIAAVLFGYQQRAQVRAAEVAAHREQLAAAAQLKAEYDAMLAEAENSGTPDGVYRGTGQGFGGDIVVDVTIEKHRISKVELISAVGEDNAYLSQAVTLLEDIPLYQSVDLDTVSGATFSSNGILDAAADALEGLS